MRRFDGFAAFQTFLMAELPARVRAGEAAGLAEAGKLIETEMRGEIGTYQSGDAGFEDWAPLAAGTLEGWDAIGGRLEGKIERGLASPGNDNPLHASGRLEASISHAVDGNRVVIGSDDPVAVYQDQGTEKRGVPFLKGETTEPGIPGREFVGRAGFRKAPEAAEAIGAAVVKAMVMP